MNTECTFSNGGYVLLSVAEGLTLSYMALRSWEAGAVGWPCAQTSGEALCFCRHVCCQRVSPCVLVACG